MFNYLINYEEPLFRPPSEAYSLILQVTLGCSWNKCVFCEMYTSKKFSVRPFEQIKKDINNIKAHGDQIKKIFLADGNAFVLSANKLLNILNEINSALPKVNRISAYALPADINSKTKDELIQIRKAGLKLLYIGIESGDDDLLKRIDKSETCSSTLEGLGKAKEAGIKLSIMVINGLGGRILTQQHAINSARLCNVIQPEYLSTLVLSYPFGLEHFRKRLNGEFEPLSTIELIQEMRTFIQNLELENTVFRSDHASNYLVLKGILNRDKNELLKKIDHVLENPNQANLREEWMRGL